MIAIIGAQTQENLLCEKNLRDLNIPVYSVTEDGSYGERGYVTHFLEHYLSSLHSTTYPYPAVYACGPHPMLRRLIDIVNRLNIPTQVSLESYMACGIGACFGCAIQTKTGYQLCCRDGPVFDAESLT